MRPGVTGAPGLIVATAGRPRNGPHRRLTGVSPSRRSLSPLEVPRPTRSSRPCSPPWPSRARTRTATASWVAFKTGRRARPARDVRGLLPRARPGPDRGAFTRPRAARKGPPRRHGRGAEGDDDRPALLGTYEVDVKAGVIRFRTRFPTEPGVSYRVVFRPTRRTARGGPRSRSATRSPEARRPRSSACPRRGTSCRRTC